MKGRKPKPTYMKLVEGNPGKRPLNKNEPVVSDISTHAPKHLSEVAKKEWARMVRLLGCGVLKATDQATLAMYCQAYGRWVEAEAHIRENGAVVKSPNGYPIQNPYLSVANKAMEQMTKLLPGMGLTPADRSRIQSEPQDEKDELTEFLKGSA